MSSDHYVEPSFTFGLELEMVYVFPVASYLALFPREQKNQDNDDDGDYIGQEQAQLYVAALLNHQWPPSARIVPSLLGVVRVEDWHTAGYNQWTVASDCSVGAGPIEIARKYGLTRDQVQENLAWGSIELVSPILQYSQEAWLSCIKQVSDDLGPQNGVGTSYNNKSTGLHVHFALEGSTELPILALKNLAVLYAIWEEVIETIHPEDRHNLNNDYAQSLWRYKQLIARNPSLRPYNPEIIDQDPSLENFLRKVYGAKDTEQLRKILGPIDDPKYCKVHFSPPFQLKPLTIEFREHRGTIDAVEIAYWVMFLQRFLSLAFRLSFYGWMCVAGNVQNDYWTQNPSLDKLLVLLQFDNDSKAYFYRKFFQYQQEAKERALAASSSSGSGSASPDGEERPKEDEISNEDDGTWVCS